MTTADLCCLAVLGAVVALMCAGMLLHPEAGQYDQLFPGPRFR